MDISSRRTASPFSSALAAFPGARAEVRPGASSYFTAPSAKLDPHLFDGSETMHLQVRTWLVNTVVDELMRRGFRGPERWLRIWLAGSGASYQWSAARDPGDLDILLGVDYIAFREANIEYTGLSDKEISDDINKQLQADLWKRTSRVEIGVNSITCLGDGSAGSALGATSTSLSRRGSAPSASPSTAAISTSRGSSGSASPSTSDFWQSRMAAALSATGQMQEAPTASSRSTTAMTRAGTEVSSASSATTTSATGTATSGSTASRSTGAAVYEITWYVNSGSTDIRAINPYAAYDVQNREWTVRPIDLPEAGPGEWFPQSWADAVQADHDRAKEIVDRYNQARTAVETSSGPRWFNATAQLTAASKDAVDLYDDIHKGRHAAFDPTGEGYRDFANYRWQRGKLLGHIQALRTIKDAVKEARKDAEYRLYGSELKKTDEVLRTAALGRVRYVR